MKLGAFIIPCTCIALSATAIMYATCRGVLVSGLADKAAYITQTCSAFVAYDGSATRTICGTDAEAAKAAKYKADTKSFLWYRYNDATYLVKDREFVSRIVEEFKALDRNSTAVSKLDVDQNGIWAKRRLLDEEMARTQEKKENFVGNGIRLSMEQNASAQMESSVADRKKNLAVAELQITDAQNRLIDQKIAILANIRYEAKIIQEEAIRSGAAIVVVNSSRTLR